MTILTKVAQIRSDTEIVLAAGSDQLVTEGMKFVIYEIGETIDDPETGESLGELEYVKGRVVAKNVQEKITLARTSTTYGFRIYRRVRTF